METARSYRPEVIADASGQWTPNGLRFPLTDAGKRAAEQWVRDLSWRWTLVRETRVVESPDEPNMTEDGEHLPKGGAA